MYKHFKLSWTLENSVCYCCTSYEIVFNWNHFEMRLLNLRINFYLLRTFCPHLGSFLCCFFFHYLSAKFLLWPSSGDLPRPQIGMMSLVTVSPVITAFHSCCLSHHVLDQVNLWPAWVGFETAIFWQCSPGTVETQRLYSLPTGCDEGHWHAHTRGLRWGLPEVVGTVQQVHCSRRRLLRRGLEFPVRTYEKSWETYSMILAYMITH